MKKESIVTAVTAAVFFAVGFLAGYIYDAQKTANAQQAIAPANTASSARQTSPAGDASQGTATDATGSRKLPPGHLPLAAAEQVRDLEQQEARNPKDPEAPLKLANLYYDNQQFQESIQWYERALELDPQNVNARTDMGTAYFSLGQPQEALAEYRKSLEIDPAHEPTLFNMIIVNLEGTHDLRAARQAWEKLYKRNPNYPGLDRLKESVGADRGSAKPAATRP